MLLSFCTLPEEVHDMKKLLLAVAAALVFNLPAFAGTDTTHDFKTMAPKLWKAHKSTTAVKSPKDDLAIVYGGEDVSRRISGDSATA
jgi:hypothetical protein